jgi:hypothetical protein
MPPVLQLFFNILVIVIVIIIVTNVYNYFTKKASTFINHFNIRKIHAIPTWLPDHLEYS